jgi:hypothetical protein
MRELLNELTLEDCIINTDNFYLLRELVEKMESARYLHGYECESDIRFIQERIRQMKRVTGLDKIANFLKGGKI